jgi:hypothetical protein
VSSFTKEGFGLDVPIPEGPVLVDNQSTTDIIGKSRISDRHIKAVNDLCLKIAGNLMTTPITDTRSCVRPAPRCVLAHVAVLRLQTLTRSVESPEQG